MYHANTVGVCDGGLETEDRLAVGCGTELDSLLGSCEGVSGEDGLAVDITNGRVLGTELGNTDPTIDGSDCAEGMMVGASVPGSLVPDSDGSACRRLLGTSDRVGNWDVAVSEWGIIDGDVDSGVGPGGIGLRVEISTHGVGKEEGSRSVGLMDGSIVSDALGAALGASLTTTAGSALGAALPTLISGSVGLKPSSLFGHTDGACMEWFWLGGADVGTEDLDEKSMRGAYVGVPLGWVPLTNCEVGDPDS